MVEGVDEDEGEDDGDDRDDRDDGEGDGDRFAENNCRLGGNGGNVIGVSRVFDAG